MGVDNVDVEEATNKKIYVTNSPNANVISVAELTIAVSYTHLTLPTSG